MDRDFPRTRTPWNMCMKIVVSHHKNQQWPRLWLTLLYLPPQQTKSTASNRNLDATRDRKRFCAVATHAKPEITRTSCSSSRHVHSSRTAGTRLARATRPAIRAGAFRNFFRNCHNYRIFRAQDIADVGSHSVAMQYVCVCMCVCVCVCVSHSSSFTDTNCNCGCADVCTYLYMCVYICMYIYVHIHISTEYCDSADAQLLAGRCLYISVYICV